MTRTLFSGGWVFDGESVPEAGRAVLVEEGRIRAVGQVAEFKGFTGRTIDTTGATLMPGLVDCHVHLCFAPDDHPDIPLRDVSETKLTGLVRDRAMATLAGGVTSIRDCGGIGAPEYRVRDMLAAAERPVPLLQACGPMIRKATDGFGDTVARVAPDGRAVVEAVHALTNDGADFINIMATIDGLITGPERIRYHDGEIADGVAAAGRLGRPVASNAQCAEDIVAVARAGVASVEQGSGLDDAAIAAMLQHDVVLVPILLARHNIYRAMQARGAPAVKLEAAARLTELTRQSARDFARAGGCIAMGTDCGAPGSEHGSNATELALMVEAGLTPLQVLVAATSAGADLMRLSDRGRIVNGARADLLLVNGNPADDISAVASRQNHRLLLAGGQVVSLH